MAGSTVTEKLELEAPLNEETGPSLCDNCRSPGHCCRDIRLYGHGHADSDALGRYMAGRAPLAAQVGVWSMELPFTHDRIDDSGQHVYRCDKLGSDGRCSDYENRPALCRVFQPGEQAECVMSCPVKVAVNHDLTLQAMLERLDGQTTGRDRGAEGV